MFDAAIVFLWFLASTFLHEMGHFIVAKLVGCSAALAFVLFYTGATQVECTYSFQLILTALAGPLTAFLVGFYLWNAGSRLTKIMAMISWFIGFLPNALFFVPSTDFYVAVLNGLNPVVAFAIFYICMLFISRCLVDYWSPSEVPLLRRFYEILSKIFDRYPDEFLLSLYLTGIAISFASLVTILSQLPFFAAFILFGLGCYLFTKRALIDKIVGSIALLYSTALFCPVETSPIHTLVTQGLLNITNAWIIYAVYIALVVYIFKKYWLF